MLIDNRHNLSAVFYMHSAADFDGKGRNDCAWESRMKNGWKPRCPVICAAFEEGRNNNSDIPDCLYDELQGSINFAFYDNKITSEQAAFLRKKYLRLEE